MVFEMDGIVEEMLQLTIQLEQEVMQSDSDPDKWLLYLDEREKMMRKIDTLISAGSPLSDANKISLAKYMTSTSVSCRSFQIGCKRYKRSLLKYNGVKQQ